jgi:hypothetical protein
MIWDAMQDHRRRGGIWCPGIAKQADLPVEAIMCPLGACEDARWPHFLREESLRETHLDALLWQKLETGPPMLPSGPITRSRNGADPPLRGDSRRLTLRGCLASFPCHWHCSRHLAGPAICDPGLIDQTEAAISLWSPFPTKQALASRAVQAPIRLEGKVLAGEATCFPRRVALVGSL